MKNVGVSRVFLLNIGVGEKFLDFMFFNVSRGIQKNDGNHCTMNEKEIPLFIHKIIGCPYPIF